MNRLDSNNAAVSFSLGVHPEPLEESKYPHLAKIITVALCIFANAAFFILLPLADAVICSACVIFVGLSLFYFLSHHPTHSENHHIPLDPARTTQINNTGMTASPPPPSLHYPQPTHGSPAPIYVVQTPADSWRGNSNSGITPYAAYPTHYTQVSNAQAAIQVGNQQAAARRRSTSEIRPQSAGLSGTPSQRDGHAAVGRSQTPPPMRSQMGNSPYASRIDPLGRSMDQGNQVRHAAVGNTSSRLSGMPTPVQAQPQSQSMRWPHGPQEAVVHF